MKQNFQELSEEFASHACAMHTRVKGVKAERIVGKIDNVYGH
jgi:hypothetical protein